MIGWMCRAAVRRTQRRCVVSRAQQGVAIKELQEEVSGKFSRAASGQPPSISTAQLVQMLFELGLADVRRQEVGDVLNVLMQHGFYCKTNPSKRDSYGPMPPPNVGLSEAQRWATLFFFKRSRKQPGLSPKPLPSLNLQKSRACAATWCQCPPGAAGTDRCALYQWQNEKAKST